MFKKSGTSYPVIPWGEGGMGGRGNLDKIKKNSYFFLEAFPKSTFGADKITSIAGHLLQKLATRIFQAAPCLVALLKTNRWKLESELLIWPVSLLPQTVSRVTGKNDLLLLHIICTQDDELWTSLEKASVWDESNSYFVLNIPWCQIMEYYQLWKVNRCLARYSPRHNDQPTHRQGTNWAGKAWPKMNRNANFGPNWVVFGQKILFLLEKSKVLLPT